jgi:hypothetical protein
MTANWRRDMLASQPRGRHMAVDQTYAIDCSAGRHTVQKSEKWLRSNANPLCATPGCGGQLTESRNRMLETIEGINQFLDFDLKRL